LSSHRKFVIAGEQEPLIQPAALQVAIELLLNERRKRSASLGARIAKWRRTRSSRTGGDGPGGQPCGGRGRNRRRGEKPPVTRQTRWRARPSRSGNAIRAASIGIRVTKAEIDDAILHSRAPADRFEQDANAGTFDIVLA